MSQTQALKIKKMLMSFNDAAGGGELQYMTENLTGAGFTQIEVPFDPEKFVPENFQMRLIAANGMDSGVLDYEFIKLCYRLSRGDLLVDQENRYLEDLKKKNPMLQGLPENFLQFNLYKDRKFASLDYCDVTERDMFGYEPIKAIDLKSESCGIWSWTGLRKFEFTVSDIIVKRDASDFTQRGCLYWNILETKPLDELLFESDLVYNEETQVYTVYCNTNEIGEVLVEGAESAHPALIGRFELHFGTNSTKEAWGFPIQLRVHDTTRDKIRKSSIVSIDFGTSSTCAAIQPAGNMELLRLSGELKNLAENEKAYENPTNLMIYDWQSFFSQWTNDNPDLPLLRSTVFDEKGEIQDRYADFDSGYTVEKMFSEVDDAKGHRKMEAILTRLKSIPMNLENENEIKFVPYNDVHGLERTVIDTLEDEDESHLNPVRFYGYLLGRIINNPARGGYYTKYYISYPVKFERKIRNLIKESLADGIMRSLPRPVRENLDVNEAFSMDYPESVACLGALIPNQLKLRQDGSPQVFAIFDLGGGTLDTSYGIYREANEEDDKESEYGQAIQLMGIGGDPYAGGENLIHQLVFEIYKHNKDEMRRLKIPFPLPPGEKMPADMDETLVKKRADRIMQTNLRTMMEKIGRPIFKYDQEDAIDSAMTSIFPSDKYPDFAQSSNTLKITLRDKDNNDQEVTLEIEGIDSFLEESMKKIVQQFETEMERVFHEKKKFLVEARLLDADSDEEFDLDEVAIFLGGNASKQRELLRQMRAVFPDPDAAHGNGRIKIIGDTEEEKGRNPSERTTVKTAVAFGQLNLDQFYLDRRAIGMGDGSVDEIPPFPFYIVYKDMGTGQWQNVMTPGDHSREWKKANLVGMDGKLNLFFTSDPGDPEKAQSKLHPITDLLPLEDTKRRTLYIRVYDGSANTLEYRFGSKKELDYSADDPSNPAYTIKLQEEN